ncbi:PAS domain-containing protein [Novosphingobium aureum]|uniref:PAS domain-containing protein n=1 Tax=Novosphingobium aureum TaxID=2792964 RepID=UPI002B4A0A45|nr:PAS domain-containing protein [Novosphingobium aureum]
MKETAPPIPLDPYSLIANSRVAAVVSDPRRDDNPIVACNEAFLALTGHSREEIIGRNCRFLRGSGTEPEQTAMLREAVAQTRPVMVELVNYRKDGTAFRNAVMVAPLFDDDGVLQYFLGSQMAIDDTQPSRHQLARSRIEGLTRRQRQILSALAKGQLNKQIAWELGVTERTVKMHRAAVLRALDVRSVAEAIRIAIEAGF